MNVAIYNITLGNCIDHVTMNITIYGIVLGFKRFSYMNIGLYAITSDNIMFSIRYIRHYTFYDHGTFNHVHHLAVLIGLC